MSTHTPLRLPESMTRVDIGPYMRGLREHFGLSQHDVSERLHIRHRYINAIENNAFDQMPGRAYAKGYVHTYAEFLGLDAEQAVEICFGPELVREHQAHFVPEPMKRNNASLPGQWRSVAVVAVIIALGALTIAQFTTGGDSGDDSETVSEVPEDMLADMRRLLMPNAQNHDCLQEETALGCIIDGAEWRTLASMRPQVIYLADARYGDELPEDEKQQEDVAKAEEEKAPAKKAVAKEKPAEPKKKPAKAPVKGKVPDAKPEGSKPVADEKKSDSKKTKPDDATEE